MRKKLTFAITCFMAAMLLLSVNSWGQGHETFDNLDAAGSYVDGTFEGQDGSTWTYVQCRGDVDIDGKAIMIGRNRSPQSEFYSGTISGGVGVISFDFMQAFSTDVNLNILINDVVVGNVTTSGEQSVVKNSGDIVVNQFGDIVIKFINQLNSNGQVVVDNIIWTGYNAPMVLNISQAPTGTPNSITINDEVLVSADVIEYDAAIDFVQLKWGTSPGDYPNEIDMTLDVGDTYIADAPIPTQADGTTVYYVIYAEDLDAESVTSAEQSYYVRGPRTTELPYQETFMDDLGDSYTFSVLGHEYYWAHGSWGGIGFAQMSGSGSDELEEDWLILPGIDMSEYAEAILNFDMLYQNASAEEDHYLNLYYSTNYDGVGDPTEAIWTEIEFTKPVSGSWDWIPSEDIDLPDTDQVLWLGFKYYYENDYPIWRIKDVSIITMANPAFDPPGGVYFEDVTVFISNYADYDADVNIYYTTNGEDPNVGSVLYDDATGILLDYVGGEEIVLKTIAIGDELQSGISSATYTFPADIDNLADVRIMEAGVTFRYTGDAVIVAMDGYRDRKFLVDETAAIMIDDNPGRITTEYELYDVITDIVGKISVYGNMVQFQPEMNTPEATENTPVEPVIFKIDDITSDDQAKLVKFLEVWFDNIDEGDVFANGRNYTITDGTNEFVLRTDFWNVDYIGEEIPHEKLTISGVILQYFETMQLIPRFADDIRYIGAEITEFGFANLEDDDILDLKISAIEDGEASIIISLAHGIDITTLNPTITISTGATIDPAPVDGEYGDMDFSSPVDFVVTADDVTIQTTYTVYVKPSFTVTFNVMDVNEDAITDAVVTFDGDANDTGEYVFENIPNGTYVYKVEKEGYIAEQGQVTVKDNNLTRDVTLAIDDTFVDEHDGIKLSVFPNPARDIITVESSEKITQIRLIDISGKMIMDVTVDEFRHQVNVSDMRSGIYFMQIHTAQSVITERIQIVR